jgi:ribonuclease HII
MIIRDSKQLTPTRRACAYDWITNNTIWAVAECSPAEIDELNILWASMTAMKRAVKKTGAKPDHCLIDGNRLPHDLIGTAVVRGDAKSLSIAAASIIAKQTRDKIMHRLARQYPQYGWDKNAGYPTKLHLRVLDQYGINEHYRKSFGPIKERIKNETSHN